MSDDFLSSESDEPSSPELPYNGNISLYNGSGPSRRLTMETPHTSTPRNSRPHALTFDPSNVNPSVLNARSVPVRSHQSRNQGSLDLMQSSICEILSEVKKTKSAMDEKMESVEQRIINLEQVQSSEDLSDTPKRKVPTRIRVSALNIANY